MAWSEITHSSTELEALADVGKRHKMLKGKKAKANHERS